MIIPVNKPSGYTSHDIVAGIKHALGGKTKTGHTGTLDPMCTGVLPILTDNYTKLSDFFPSDKAYKCTILLGTITETQDTTGEIVSINDVHTSESEFIAALNGFTGEIKQIPPMYSSIKKNGVPLYKLARKGVSVEREARTVNIYKIEYNGKKDDNTYNFTVFCSAGTYIRTLCADIGDVLGCGACMASLERIRSNGITIDSCYDYHDVLILAENGMLSSISIPCETAFGQFDKISVLDSARIYYLNGGVINRERIIGDLNPYEKYLAYSERNEFLGLACADEALNIKSIWNK